MAPPPFPSYYSAFIGVSDNLLRFAGKILRLAQIKAKNRMRGFADAV
jgi:hypothetical protein